MQFVEQKKQKRRASSAKNSQRPTSGHLSRQTEKVDLISNLYGGTPSTKRDRDSKAIQRLLQGFSQEKDVFNNTSVRYKETEQLYQENMTLKKTVNNLRKEVELQRGKTEVFRRRNSQYTKKLSIEHQKQMYWGSCKNSNLVMGIKNQYEMMKEKYDQKCRECEQMAQQYILCESKEQQAFIEILIQQNNKLKKNLDEARKELKDVHHVEESMDAHRLNKYQLYQQNERLKNDLESLKLENTINKQKMQGLRKKISFLDRLLIEKDNGDHASRKSLKKVEKEKQDISDIFSNYKQESEKKIQSLQKQIKQIKTTAEKQAQQEIFIFKRELQEKNLIVDKLEKEVAYLTTILSYWKPLDQLNEMVATNMLGTSSQDDHNFLLEYSKSIGGSMMKFSKNYQNQIQREEDDAKSITQSIINKSMRNSIGVSRRGSIEVTRHPQNKNISDMMAKSIDLGKERESDSRKQITADKRYSENSVKCRKIHHDQIIDICETLKYRFIGLDKTIEEIRAFFDYQHDESDILMSEEEESWKKMYINMEEVKNILTDRFMNLSDQDAQILSRYLIEDSETDYVYRDLANENLRTVVKSILKNIIGDYEVLVNKEEIKKKAVELMNKYETNFEAALKTTAPKGVISKKKLLELFKGLGIQLNLEIQNYFLGKLAVNSNNMSTLQYQFLFQK